MDIADDIAYATYDLEDALKAGFFSPLGVLGATRNQQLMQRISAKVWRTINERSDLISLDNPPT